METATPPRSIKLTIKYKRDKSITNCSTTPDLPNNAEYECSKSQAHTNSTEQEQNNSPEEDEENPCTENSEYQLVLYDPSVNEASDSENELESVNQQPPFHRVHPFSDQTQRVLPSIGAFTVQCAECFQWRLIPTKEKYEEIRENIIEQPFTCEMAREWKPDISCEDPPDITQDGSRLWAIDKPSIAQPPPGWQRLLRIRGEGGTKFADVYYVSPSGKTLRSRVEIQKYLNEHPKYMHEGVNLSQFSFQIPRPLQENYVRKHPTARPLPVNNSSQHALPGYLPPSEAKAITWVSPNTDLQLNGFGTPGKDFERRSSKKKRKIQKWNPDLVINLDDDDVDDEVSIAEPHQL
ncbi:methyl-CPG-binding domain protein 02 [Striga asiatica]|uniref:Methyl-CPG-binding domain protein 02 n=1 Tax=Striga asiatica TaxID=4170 RepID=A0A5A7Q903_STRAF|nr:methyl-CPG-binding domain protein 02 [Striga asiatica]